MHPAIPDEPGQVDTSRLGEHSVAKLGDFPVGLGVYATTLSLFSGQSWTGSMLLETRTVQEAAGLLTVSSRRAAPQGHVDERAEAARRAPCRYVEEAFQGESRRAVARTLRARATGTADRLGAAHGARGEQRWGPRAYTGLEPGDEQEVTRARRSGNPLIG